MGMNDTSEIRELSDPREIDASFDVMKQLRPHLARDTYVATVQSLMQGGYRLAAVFVAGRVEAVAGYRFGASLAWGTFLYVDDLVTDDRARSNGHGKLLLDWLKREAIAHDCRELHLDSGVQRFDAHRFYLRERMNITSHHFQIGVR
jgi:GNAT superfamily N-acetyltransferase